MQFKCKKESCAVYQEGTMNDEMYKSVFSFNLPKKVFEEA